MTEAEQLITLKCTDVVKSFPVQEDIRLWRILLGVELEGQKVVAVDNVSMSVPFGKIVGILGRNGAGKSTLLRVLGGIYPPTSGTVEVLGQIGGLFEMGGMEDPSLTGRDYANRYLDAMDVPDSKRSALLDDIAEFSELEEVLDDRVRTYSSGMQARLYFSVATSLEHEIYLIDELLSVGDEHFVAKSWRRMRERLLNGASGVLVTHDWESVLKLCEYSHVMERGSFVFSGRSDAAVVSYLDLQLPNAEIARFSPDNPSSYVVKAGESAHLNFLVEVFDAEPVDFAISIEMLRIGVGWEIVLLKDQIPVASEPGKHTVQVSIPAFPLDPGEYSLNLFLSRRRENSIDQPVGYDMRSWTTGNGYQLTVEGEPSKTMVNIPYVARKIGTGS